MAAILDRILSGGAAPSGISVVEKILESHHTRHGIYLDATTQYSAVTPVKYRTSIYVRVQISRCLHEMVYINI